MPQVKRPLPETPLQRSAKGPAWPTAIDFCLQELEAKPRSITGGPPEFVVGILCLAFDLAHAEINHQLRGGTSSWFPFSDH